MYNFIRAAAAAPKLKVADCVYNKQEIINVICDAEKYGVKILSFPELCITSYTCGDLFGQTTLLKSAEKALFDILEYTKNKDIFIALGIPVTADSQTFNCMAAIWKGSILGVVPKTFVPNYSEFYEQRWFSSAYDLISDKVTLCGQTVPIGNDLIFNAPNVDYLSIGIEVCEDLWSPVPPSCKLAVSGASVILNGSASNELAAKNEYRLSLVSQQSARTISAYLYSSAGIGESTQDMVFSGHNIISENGSIIMQSDRFSKENSMIFCDIDLEALNNDRRKNTSFMAYASKYVGEVRKVDFGIENNDEYKFLSRTINSRPFIPANDQNLERRCRDIFNIQVAGLSKRFKHTNAKTMVMGISGGLDSTLALLVAAKACDFAEVDRSSIIGVTMPGFGTTDRTYNNAVNLIKALGASFREINIKDSVIQHFKDIGHDYSVHDVTYENSQARERTQILMDIANKENGFVVGTGDLSELALGWATYNGDHMSMYGVNSGVPKTLVRVLVNWIARSGALDKESSEILLDVLETPVSPELLPPDENGKISQKTEDLVGPYELHDFFLYYAVRFGFEPQKIFYIAKNAFADEYDADTILKWLKNFYRRFFSQQFKRSCLPDGPKVGTVCLSPRGDWRMPSDASSRIWLERLESL